MLPFESAEMVIDCTAKESIITSAVIIVSFLFDFMEDLLIVFLQSVVCTGELKNLSGSLYRH